ncbi:MAG: extracellular solute-binding protein [Paracoccaceae bacterium]|nr:extracellular solute-binding protein [Paracoccaceae bacterium]
MRFAYFTYLLAAFVFLKSFALAFEIEDNKYYEVEKNEQILRIISTADIEAFEPIILAFQKEFQTIAIDYVVASSSQTMEAIYNENGKFDLVISSAMDLQTKLANDGLAQTYKSLETEKLPIWAQWRNQVYGFTHEPAVMVISKKEYGNLPLPKTRDQFVELLRRNSEKFIGRIGTYDVSQSGLGYLFATQDSRNTDSFWRLIEMIGRLDVELYCCSGSMIEDVSSGRLVLAYNVLGSYAENSLKKFPGLKIISFDDFSTIMMRTALIPMAAKRPDLSGKMIDFLLQLHSKPDLVALSGLQPITRHNLLDDKRTRPIRLGPGLLVFLDKLRKENFLRNWESSISQE